MSIFIQAFSYLNLTLNLNEIPYKFFFPILFHQPHLKSSSDFYNKAKILNVDSRFQLDFKIIRSLITPIYTAWFHSILSPALCNTGMLAFSQAIVYFPTTAGPTFGTPTSGPSTYVT